MRQTTRKVSVFYIVDPLCKYSTFDSTAQACYALVEAFRLLRFSLAPVAAGAFSFEQPLLSLRNSPYDAQRLFGRACYVGFPIPKRKPFTLWDRKLTAI